jgi:hypothetical protein
MSSKVETNIDRNSDEINFDGNPISTLPIPVALYGSTKLQMNS